MSRPFKMMGYGFIVIFLCGCASTMVVEKTTAMATTATQDKFSYDLSTSGADSGQLIVQCRPPTNQMLVNKYAIAIDTYAPLIVTKESDTDIKINAGEHTIKFYATSGRPEDSQKVTFGKPTQKVVVVSKEKAQTVKYTGPWRLFGQGKVEIVQ